MTEVKKNLFDKVALSYFLTLAAAGVLYYVTCAPGILWQDSGLFIYRIWHNDLQGNLGLALSHPLYIMIGVAAKMLPIGSFAHRVNFISAFFGAVAVANLFLFMRLWLDKALPALVAAVTLAFSWTFWQHAAIAEVYTLYVAIFSAELIFLLLYIKKRQVSFLCWLGFLNGLAIANHMFGVIPLACYGVYVIILLYKCQIRIRDLTLIILLWLVGVSPYAVIVIREMVASGDLVGTICSVFFGLGWEQGVLNAGISGRMVLENFAFIGYNFASPGILLLFAGLLGLRKNSVDKVMGRFVLVLLVLFFLFAFRYKVPDRYAFFIPFYYLASVCIGIGGHLVFLRWTKKWVKVSVLTLAFMPLAVYWFVPILAERAEVSVGTKRTIPYRNDYTYFLRPWQGRNLAPEIFATEALNVAENDSMIIADGTVVYALWYMQEIEGLRCDVKVVSSHGSYASPLPVPGAEEIEDVMDQRAVYVVSPVNGYCPKFLLDNYDFVEFWPLHRAVVRLQSQ